MKKSPLFVLLIALLCCSLSHTAYAHALWIESSSTAAPKNAVQTVKVFYGEYEHGTKDWGKDWYAGLKAPELYVQHPNRQSTRLEPHVADDALVAPPPPEQRGQ